MSKVLISDTNIWIDFHRAGRLKELFALPFQFVTTDFACSELSSPTETELRILGMRVVGFEADEVKEIYALRLTIRNPSLADVSCYYLAKRDNHILLTGDARLRQAARETRMEVFGTLWLLDRMVEHLVLAPADAANTLTRMLAANSRFPKDECESRFSRWRN